MTATYKTGTAAVSNGSVNVVGTGTAWAVALVVGGMFSCNGLSVPIASVVDDTHLTLDYAWPGTTGSGQSYSILRETSDAANMVDLYDKLSQLLVDLSLAGIHPDNSGSLAKRDALTLNVSNDGYLYLRAELGVAFAFYRWDGPSLAWVGPFPVASATTAAAGVQSIVAGNGISVDNTNPNIPVVAMSGVLNSNAAALPAPPANTSLQIGGADGVSARFVLDSFGNAANFTLRTSSGTAAARGALGNNATFGVFAGFGAYDATNYSSTSRASMNFVTAEDWDATHQGSKITFATTPLGGTSARVVGTFGPDGSLQVNPNAAALPAGSNGTVLQIGGADGQPARYLVDSFANQALINVRRANGTNAARSALVAGDIIGGFGAYGAYDATNYSPSQRAAISGVAAENWDATHQGTKIDFYTTLNGTIASAVVFTIDNDGGLKKVGSGQSSLKRVGIAGGAPVASGGNDPNQFMVAGNENVDWRFGFYSNGAMWSQPSIVGGYNINLSQILNPNGGNVGIGNTGQNPVSLLTVAGKISSIVAPTTSPQFDIANSPQQSIASGAEIALAVGSGVLVINEDQSTGAVGLFLLGGGATTKVAGDASYVVSTSSPTTSQIAVYYDGAAARYKVKNGFATTKLLRVLWFATRISN